MSTRARSHQGMRLTTVVAWALLVCAGAQAQSGPTEYSAEYSASYKGRNVGTSQFSVMLDAGTGRYVYLSDTRAKGLLKMVSPNPAIDRSEFVVRDGTIVPISFHHEDGSRKGEDNHTIEFDWQAREARVAGASSNRSIPLEDGMLDRGTLQVALMYDASRGLEPSRYTVVDDDSATTYELVFEGRRMVTTALGELEVLSYAQQREGSSRRTVVELAPALGYVPVRIEQFRDGESRSAFVIESLTRP